MSSVGNQRTGGKEQQTRGKALFAGATASDNVADAFTDETCAPGVIQLDNDCFAGGIVGTDAVNRSSPSAEAETRREKLGAGR